MVTALTPLLTLDLKKHRIRIHKQTLRLLNNPKYCQLLVNPENQIIALQGQAEKTPQSHKVSYSAPHGSDLYSKELIMQLQIVNRNLISGKTYRIPGRVYPGRGIAVFHMEKCTPVDDPLPLHSLFPERTE